MTDVWTSSSPLYALGDFAEVTRVFMNLHTQNASAIISDALPHDELVLLKPKVLETIIPALIEEALRI